MGLLPMAALAALVNPAFNHEGATILTYLPSGNPLTLESMLYGAAAAVMLASVVLWFSSFNEVITSDKFVYLFGRILPALSLVLSMGAALYPEIQGTAASRIRSADMYWKGHENRQRIPPRRKCHSDFFHYGHMEPGKRD